MSKFSTLFEILMVVLFGLSWPFNIIRAYKAKSTKGTSLAFILFILIGYICGILSKIFAGIVNGPKYWSPLIILAFVFYCVNFSMLCTALVIYFRNKHLDNIKIIDK